MSVAWQLVFAAGETTKRFVVFVMDDDCKEHYSEYAQVSVAWSTGSDSHG